MLVSKEIAIGLKKIGFNEPCDYASSGDSDDAYLAAKMPWKTEVPWKIKNSEMMWDFPGGVKPGRCTRPDKYQAFAWFRNKGLIGIIHPMDCGRFYAYIFHGNTSTVAPNPPHDEFETWEEAEDKCILKMIELHG